VWSGAVSSAYVAAADELPCDFSLTSTPSSSISYSSLAQEIALFFDAEASCAIAACRVMLPLLRASTVTASSSAFTSRSCDGGDAADGIVGALLDFEEASGAWLRDMTIMQQQQLKHQLLKAKKVAGMLEAAAGKLNSARRALVMSSSSSSSSSDHDSSSILVTSIYHLCMSR
jgi:hypothetical protein